MYLLLVSCILVSRINKLKKWLFYIYLLTTITKALYQSSEKGMSLLFTCPQLTGRRKLTTGCCCKNVAALYCTCYAIYFCQVESIPQFLELWPISMHFDGTFNFTLLYRNATMYSIIRCVLLITFAGHCRPRPKSHLKLPCILVVYSKAVVYNLESGSLQLVKWWFTVKQ